MRKPGDTTPFERMVDFTRRIVAIPKSELDKRKRAEQRKKARQTEKRAPA